LLLPLLLPWLLLLLSWRLLLLLLPWLRPKGVRRLTRREKNVGSAELMAGCTTRLKPKVCGAWYFFFTGFSVPAAATVLSKRWEERSKRGEHTAQAVCEQ
jgi:hypothetical protein